MAHPEGVGQGEEARGREYPLAQAASVATPTSTLARAPPRLGQAGRGPPGGARASKWEEG